MNNRKTTRVSTLKSEVLLNLAKKKIGLGFDFRIVVVVFFRSSDSRIEVRNSIKNIAWKNHELEFFFVWSVFARSQRSTICLSERTEELCVEGRKCIFRAGSREGVRGVAGVAMATLIFCILFNKIKRSVYPKFPSTQVPKFPCTQELKFPGSQKGRWKIVCRYVLLQTTPIWISYRPPWLGEMAFWRFLSHLSIIELYRGDCRFRYRVRCSAFMGSCKMQLVV